MVPSGFKVIMPLMLAKTHTVAWYTTRPLSSGRSETVRLNCGSHSTEICLFQPGSANYLFKCGSHSTAVYIYVCSSQGVLTTCTSVVLILLLQVRYVCSSLGVLTTCTSVALILMQYIYVCSSLGVLTTCTSVALILIYIYVPAREC